MDSYGIELLISFILLFGSLVLFVSFDKKWLLIITFIGMILMLTGLILSNNNRTQTIYECNVDFNNSSDENFEVVYYELKDNIFIIEYEDGSKGYIHLRDNDSIVCKEKEEE